MNDTFEKRNETIYAFARQQLVKAKTDGSRLDAFAAQASWLATFAFLNHPGFYADSELERLLGALEVGPAAVPSPQTEGAVVRRGTPLYVISHLLATGGHPRLLLTLMEEDGFKEHHLAVTCQDSKDVPSNIRELLDKVGAHVDCIPQSLDLPSRVRMLSERGAEHSFVYLHTHPGDVLPLLAFRPPFSRPVVLQDHAHYNFWLGVSIADLVVETLPCMKEFTPAFRRVRKNHCLRAGSPTQIDRFTGFRLPDDEKRAVKESIGIPTDHVVLATMGGLTKYFPTIEQNFFATSSRILGRCPNTSLVFIGVGRDSVLLAPLVRAFPDRVVALGPVPDPRRILACAELFLEPFPLCSAGSLFEAVLLGCCPVFAFNDEPNLFSSAWDGTLQPPSELVPCTEAEYLDAVEFLVDHPERARQLTALVGEQILRNAQEFGPSIRELMTIAADLTHDVCIPPAVPRADTRMSRVMSEASERPTLEGALEFWRRYFTWKDELVLLWRLARAGCCLGEIPGALARIAGRAVRRAVRRGGADGEPAWSR